MGGNESLLRHLQEKTRRLEKIVKLHEENKKDYKIIIKDLKEQVSILKERERILEEKAFQKHRSFLEEGKKLQSEESDENVLVATIRDRKIPIFTRDFLEEIQMLGPPGFVLVF